MTESSSLLSLLKQTDNIVLPILVLHLPDPVAILPGAVVEPVKELAVKKESGEEGKVVVEIMEGSVEAGDDGIYYLGLIQIWRAIMLD